HWTGRSGQGPQRPGRQAARPAGRPAGHPGRGRLACGAGGVLMGLRRGASSLNHLKGLAATGGEQDRVIRETAKQLESLFMQELMKSMRATTMSTGMLDNSATEMGTSMLDSQMSTQMSGLPGGLSELIVRQLQQQMGAISGDTQ